jgi:hypothetical protein
MISAVRVTRLDTPDEATPQDPQLLTLSCMFCEAVQTSTVALARHLNREHPDRSDFPILFFGRVDDPVGSSIIARRVLEEIDLMLFARLKMKSVQGRMVSAFKRILIKVVCPPGAFDSIVQSFSLKPRWTPSGMLIIDGATGATISSMIGANSLQRDFGTFKAVIDPNDTIRFTWMAQPIKDHQGVRRRGAYYLKLRLACRSQFALRARPRVQRSMQ